MLTELRRYTIMPGHMDAMHARMTDMLLPLFAQHDIPMPRAIWDNRDDTSTFSWMVDWPDFEARQAGWARIAPHFSAARLAEGTSEFVTRTTLTVIAPWAGHDVGFAAEGRCEAAWHVQPAIGFGLTFATVCQNEALAMFQGAGACAINGCNFLFGPLPQAMLLLSWPDTDSRAAGMAALRERTMPPTLETSLPGNGPRFGDRGEWEILDRAPYLAG